MKNSQMVLTQFIANSLGDLEPLTLELELEDAFRLIGAAKLAVEEKLLLAAGREITGGKKTRSDVVTVLKKTRAA